LTAFSLVTWRPTTTGAAASCVGAGLLAVRVATADSVADDAVAVPLPLSAPPPPPAAAAAAAAAADDDDDDDDDDAPALPV